MDTIPHDEDPAGRPPYPDTMGEGLDELQHRVHPLSRSLAAEGLELFSERLSDHASSLFTGLRFERGSSEIAYRLRDPETVIIAIYRRIREIRGLKSPFDDFVWFVEYLRRPELGLKWVMGMPKQRRDLSGGLSTERIVRFYKEYLNGKTLCRHAGSEWIYLRLQDYKPPRQCRAERRTGRG